MKEYKGVRTLEDIIKRATEKGYEYKYVNFQSRLVKGNLDICIRSFGKFFVYRNGKCIACELSQRRDNKPWYLEILDILYVEEELVES